jgi:hypothetical protein
MKTKKPSDQKSRRHQVFRENILIQEPTRVPAHLPALLRRQRHLCLLTKARKPGHGPKPIPLLMLTLKELPASYQHPPETQYPRVS